MKNFPKQRLPYSQKIANDYKWAKEVMDNLFTDYQGDNSVINGVRSDYDRMLSNYQLYNNQLNQADFERECNPLGIEIGQFRDEIQPYNKTYNKIQVLLGEELRRPFRYKVILTDPEGVRSKLAFRDGLYKNYVMSHIQAAMEEFGLQVPEPLFDPAILMDPSEVERYMSLSYLDTKEILASKILNYLERKLSIRDLKNDSFKHGLISGGEFVYVGKRNDEPYVEPLNPLGVFYHKSAEVKYIQDSLYAGYRTYMTSGDIIDMFGAYLTDEDLTKLDASQDSFGFHSDETLNANMDYYHDNGVLNRYYSSSLTEGSYSNPTSTSQDWLVQHVEWMSQKRVGFLSYVNEYGDPDVDLVSEDFSVPDNAIKLRQKKFNYTETVYNWTDPLTQKSYSLTWGWLPEVWSGVRIGKDIYCMVGPKEYQFRDLSNPYSVKLGYHGLTYNAMNAQSTSLMDRMKPFQYLYFIVMHKLKKFIAQDKGKVFPLDITMVDPKVGLEKTLYYLSTLNLDIYNPLMNTDVQGWSQRAKVTNAIDMSVADQVMNYVNILNAIDQQISDVAGITRQREGQASPSEAVTNAQSNIQMSGIITEVYFQAHDKLWEHVLNSLIDVAQACYKHKPQIKQWILDDMSVATLDFTPDSITTASFGVFVIDSAKEQYIFDTLQQWGQALVQNDKANFSDLVKMLRTNSTQELQSHIEQSERDKLKEQQQLQQQQIEGQKQLQQAQREFQLEMQARDHENKLAIAELDTFKFLRDQDANDNGIPDQFEIEKFKTEADIKYRQLELQKQKMKQDKELKEKDLQIKKNKPAAKK